MSQKNVDIVMALVPAPGTDAAQMIRSLRDANVAAATSTSLEHLFDPDFEAITRYNGTTFREPYGLRDLWRDWLEPWAT